MHRTWTRIYQIVSSLPWFLRIRSTIITNSIHFEGERPAYVAILPNASSASARILVRSSSERAIVLLIAKMFLGSMCSFRACCQSKALGDTVRSMNFFLILPTPSMQDSTTEVVRRWMKAGLVSLSAQFLSIQLITGSLLSLQKGRN